MQNYIFFDKYSNKTLADQQRHLKHRAKCAKWDTSLSHMLTTSVVTNDFCGHYGGVNLVEKC